MGASDTTGKNFPLGLPKVSSGDRINTDNINKLSAMVQQNSMISAAGSIVKRGPSGTNIVANEFNSRFPAFTTWLQKGKVCVRVGNIWYGKNSMESIKRLIFYKEDKKIPWMNVECKIKGKEFSKGAPYILSFDYTKGSDMVVFVDASGRTPEIKYENMENLEGMINDKKPKYFIPIAMHDSQGSIIQIQSGDIWLGDTYNSNSHPFKVYAKGTSQVSVEYGSIFTYGKDEYLDIGTDGYPNAVKIEGGSTYLTKEDDAVFSVKDGDSIYFKFVREGGGGADTPTWTDYGKTESGTSTDAPSTKWKVTLCAGEMGTGLIYGNYNIVHQDPPCGVDEYHECPDSITSVKTTKVGHTDLTITSISKSYGGKMFSYGEIYYEIAKIKTGTVKNPETGKDEITIVPDQRLRSDFFFYPPLDNQYGFTDTYVSAFSSGTTLPSGHGGHFGDTLLNPNVG